jgi:tetratricopeptide (TPR) repeat protein
LLFVATFALAEAPRGYIARPLDPGVDYNQRARDAYAAGVWTLDEIAASDSKLTPSEATHVHERAQAAFEEAVRAEPTMYEAHTYLGYIHRKLGRFDRSLQAYAIALKLKPDFVHAIEYQGEAYLGMGDFDRARFNYLRLYALDQALAAKLLDAMSEWTRVTNGTDRDAARAWIAAQRQRGAQ